MISILFPFKNTESFLEECLQSIFAQTYENWELLAVNDHSVDGSVEILRDFAKRDSRVKVFENQGNGIIDALNTASQHINGNFVTRMDSDDVMAERKLELKRNLLLHAGEGTVATAKVKYFSDRKVGNGYLKYESWLNELVEKKTHWEELFKECVIASPCWMLHRKDFDSINGFRDCAYPEDYNFIFRLWEKNFKVVGSNDILLHWREHPQRTSRNNIFFTDLYFSKMKVHFFIKHFTQDDEKKLLVWGAGRKGKDIVCELKKHKENIEWVSANPNKIGKKINGFELQRISDVNLKEYKHIITIADPLAQNTIQKLLLKDGLKRNCDFFFFA